MTHTPTNELTGTFWRLWLSTASSNLSDGIGKTAFPLLFALPSGAIVDRVDRSRAMAVANAVRAVIVGVLAISVTATTVSRRLGRGRAPALGVGGRARVPRPRRRARCGDRRPPARDLVVGGPFGTS